MLVEMEGTALVATMCMISNSQMTVFTRRESGSQSLSEGPAQHSFRSPQRQAGQTPIDFGTRDFARGGSMAGFRDEAANGSSEAPVSWPFHERF